MKKKTDFVSADEAVKKRISSDPKLNALKQMRDLETDPEAKAEIQAFINQRVAEICSEL